MRIIDISTDLRNFTGVKIELQKNLPVYLGYECYAYNFFIPSHTGTYFETSSHLFRNGRNTEEWPIEKFFLEGVIVRLSKKEKGNDINYDDLNNSGVKVKPGDALLVYTGGDNSRYFTRDAVQWMIEKGIVLLGADIERYDTGFINPTGMFIDLFKADVSIIAGLTNLDKITKDRFRLFVFPLKISGVCTVPCRVIVIEE